jgi:predicted phosphodiesterase
MHDMKNIYIYLIFLFCTRGAGFEPFDSKPYLTPTASPTSSICINWNTVERESTIVVFGLTMALVDTVRHEGVRYHHHVCLEGLEAGAQYFYRVLPDRDIKKFTTVPEYADSFSFVIFGDTRGDSIVHQSVIDRIAAYGIDFLVHTGDLVLEGDDTDNWRTFFNVEDTILQHTLFVPALGNHEKPYWPYDTLFALPDSEYFYSFRYGNAMFIILDTDGDVEGLQKEWLAGRLASARSDKTIDWLFVVFHRPAYSAGRYGDRMRIRDAWSLLFEEYGVDIAFAGHDHNYQRTEEINGVIYVISGGGSAILYDVEDRDWLACGEPVYHFCLIQIDGRRMTLRAIKPDGAVFDTLVIEK